MTLNEWQKLFKLPSTFIVQASAPGGSDAWTEYPIGMAYFWYNECDINSKTLQIGNHSNTVLCAIGSRTDIRRRGHLPVNRQNIVKTLEKNNIINISKLSHTDYYESLSNYKFVISPEGNGIDCHRHYESLMAGCIPIIEKNPLTETKYIGLPILYTTDYSEINEAYLNDIYLKMQNQIYDFSRLFISFYSDANKKLIYDSSAYWFNKRGVPGKFYN